MNVKTSNALVLLLLRLLLLLPGYYSILPALAVW